MLGKFVRVRITNPVGSLNRQYGYRYSLNFGSLEGRRQFDNRFAGAYIMGVHHPVRHFDGRAIAVLYREGERKGILVVAPKNMRFIGYQIADALAFADQKVDVGQGLEGAIPFVHALHRDHRRLRVGGFFDHGRPPAIS